VGSQGWEPTLLFLLFQLEPLLKVEMGLSELKVKTSWLRVKVEMSSLDQRSSDLAQTESGNELSYVEGRMHSMV